MAYVLMTFICTQTSVCVVAHVPYTVHVCVYMLTHVYTIYSHTCAHTHTHTHTPVHTHTHTDQTQVHLPDQEVDADDTLRLGAPAP